MGYVVPSMLLVCHSERSEESVMWFFPLRNTSFSPNAHVCHSDPEHSGEESLVCCPPPMDTSLYPPRYGNVPVCHSECSEESLVWHYSLRNMQSCHPRALFVILTPGIRGKNPLYATNPQKILRRTLPSMTTSSSLFRAAHCENEEVFLLSYYAKGRMAYLLRLYLDEST